MNKRVFSIALALILALACMSCVFASEPQIPIPGEGGGSVWPPNVASSTGAVLPASFALSVTMRPTAAQKVAFDILTKSATSADNLTAFLGAQTMTAVTDSVPGVDVSKLALDAAYPLAVFGYDVAIGDITVTMAMPRQYADGDVIVALVGIINADGTFTWTPVQATVVNVNVAVTFTQDILAVADTNELVFALLSEGVT